jgi:hypothetical protein
MTFGYVTAPALKTMSQQTRLQVGISKWHVPPATQATFRLYLKGTVQPHTRNLIHAKTACWLQDLSFHQIVGWKL